MQNNIMFILSVCEILNLDIEKAIDYWFERLELNDYRTKTAEQLSKGNQQKIQLISALLSDPELLILDDLGSEFVTQFTSAELFRIINTRLVSGGKMIISTNLNREMLKKTYNERIASRITGNFSILEFLGDDIRSIKNIL